MDLGCAVCGKPGSYQGVLRGGPEGERPHPNPSWEHSVTGGVAFASEHHDHPFVPAEGRTPEADIARSGAKYDQAQAAVSESNRQEAAYQNARTRVNVLFNDRR